jgi:hypothetical protein
LIRIPNESRIFVQTDGPLAETSGRKTSKMMLITADSLVTARDIGLKMICISPAYFR